MRIITTRAELLELKRELGVRADWHEPDEQDIVAAVFGRNFDNAGFWPQEAHPNLPSAAQELHVIIRRRNVDEHGEEHFDGEAIAAVNLAMLFAWATGYESLEEHADARRIRDLENALRTAREDSELYRQAWQSSQAELAEAHQALGQAMLRRPAILDESVSITEETEWAVRFDDGDIEFLGVGDEGEREARQQYGAYTPNAEDRHQPVAEDATTDNGYVTAILKRTRRLQINTWVVELEREVK